MVDLALNIDDLVLEFGKGDAAVRALDGVNLAVQSGTILGIVGESGSGKSTVGFAAGRLMPKGVRPLRGQLEVLGQPVWDMPIDDMREMRRNTLRYVFQDPIATLDPTKRIGWQLKHAFEPQLNDGDIVSALEQVGLPDPQQVVSAWPHELSGGMAQRVVIAMALLGDPKIIVADEATSALDASVRIRVLELLRDQSRKLGITLLLLSHDLWAVRRFCDQIAVMYGGRIVEHGPAEQVFAAPAHPYTQALLRATAGHERPGETLNTIPGIPPLLRAESQGCAFAPRCELAARLESVLCNNERPRNSAVAESWSLLCHHHEVAAEEVDTHGSA